MQVIVKKIVQNSHAFAAEAQVIFSRYEESKSRVISLKLTRDRLLGLSLSQENLLEQALRCIEYDLHKAAHVMAWAAFMDYLEMRLSEDGLKKVWITRPKWEKFGPIEELRENVSEFQLLDAAKDLGLIKKGENKTLHGLLSKRNECAHPSKYNPDLNEALGYTTEIIKRIEQIMKRSL